MRLEGHNSNTNARKQTDVKQRLHEHIKPAMSLLILGGIDAAFNPAFTYPCKSGIQAAPLPVFNHNQS